MMRYSLIFAFLFLPQILWGEEYEIYPQKQAPVSKIGVILTFPNSFQEELKEKEFPWLLGVNVASEGFRNYVMGDYLGKHVVISSVWPTKVGASIVASNMILRHHVDFILVIGSCYSRDPQSTFGSVVVSSGYVHYDTDLRPIFLRFEAPEARTTIFPTSEQFGKAVLLGSHKFLKQEGSAIEGLLKKYGFIKDDASGKYFVHNGIIATGEAFSISKKHFQFLQREIPNLAAFDNSGGAIAQVCYEYNIPYMGVNIVEPHFIESPSGDLWSNYQNEIRRVYTAALLPILTKEICYQH